MSDTRDKAALEHFEATTGGHWTSWPDSQQTDALQDFKAGWDAAVAARPLPDRETLARAIAEEGGDDFCFRGEREDYAYWASKSEDRAYWLAKADAVLSLFTTDTTEENPNG